MLPTPYRTFVGALCKEYDDDDDDDVDDNDGFLHYKCSDSAERLLLSIRV